MCLIDYCRAIVQAPDNTAAQNYYYVLRRSKLNFLLDFHTVLMSVVIYLFLKGLGDKE